MYRKNKNLFHGFGIKVAKEIEYVIDWASLCQVATTVGSRSSLWRPVPGTLMNVFAWSWSTRIDPPPAVKGGLKSGTWSA